MKSSLLLTGIGLRAPHHSLFMETKPGVAWVEVHAENYFTEGNRDYLKKVREYCPVSLHGVGLSLGSTDELNWQHLNQVRDLIIDIDPCLFSEHLSWSSVNGQYFHDLLPLPYTQEALIHVVKRIEQVQSYLKRQILIENITSYVNYTASTMSEAEFLSDVVKQSGCGILLDISNLYVNAKNLGYEPLDYLRTLPASAVQEIHLGGFSPRIMTGKEVLIDSHNQSISTDVLNLYRQATYLLGRKPTIIEWDDHLPTLNELVLEAEQVEQILRENYVAA